MMLAYVKDMPDILLCISLSNKAGWDSISVVSGKIFLESVDSGHYDIINVLYKFYGLNKRIGLKNLHKAAWHNYLSI